MCAHAHVFQNTVFVCNPGLNLGQFYLSLQVTNMWVIFAAVTL